jgi:hypothetical protein
MEADVVGGTGRKSLTFPTSFGVLNFCTSRNEGSLASNAAEECTASNSSGDRGLPIFAFFARARTQSGDVRSANGVKNGCLNRRTTECSLDYLYLYPAYAPLRRHCTLKGENNSSYSQVLCFDDGMRVWETAMNAANYQEKL